MIIVLVQLLMTAATVCFAAGYGVRHRHNPMHRKLMGLGFGLTVGTALVLVAGVHLMGAGYGPAAWLVQAAGGAAGARAVLVAHRVLATLTFVLLAAQVYTGWRRHRLHHVLHRAVVPLWLLSYASGMVIFDAV